MRLLPLAFLMIALTSLACGPAWAQGKLSSASFSGIVIHVSDANIKVTDPKSKQTLSFLILPGFNQVFSTDGRTTSRMTSLKPGQYVKIYYDQRIVGQRRADRIILLTHQR